MAPPGLPCICLLLLLEEMSSHLENVNFKTESRKVILKPSRFAFLCSSEAHGIDFCLDFPGKLQLGRAGVAILNSRDTGPLKEAVWVFLR